MRRILTSIYLVFSILSNAQDTIPIQKQDTTVLNFDDLEGTDSIYNIRIIKFDYKKINIVKSKSDVALQDFTWINEILKTPFDYPYVDKMSYQYYIENDWDLLIKFANDALNLEIDFKNLRKRIAYAYFMNGNYPLAELHYLRALEFDQYDPDTRLYLYYCAINTANANAAGYHAYKLDNGTKNKLQISNFQLIDLMDFEYNYKTNTEVSALRSNPNYKRIGINSKLNNRLSVYQTISEYKQTLEINTPIVQQEYYASMNWKASKNINLNLAYHGVSTLENNIALLAKLFYGKISVTTSWLNYGINNSSYTDPAGNIFNQLGISAGFRTHSNHSLKITSSLNLLSDSINSQLIFAQKIGAQVTKSLWLESSITTGNLKNYHESDAMYLYNSVDATTFRTGISAYLNLSKNISLTGNYTYDIKVLENTQIQYNQHSFSGGIIWKL